MFPDEKVMCHRAGFAMSCFDGVTKHKCRLWKHVSLEGDPRLPQGATQSAVDHWDCADSLQDLYLRDMLRRQLQTTATVDKVAASVDKVGAEVKQGNDQDMVLGMNQLRAQLGLTGNGHALPAPSGPLMIEQG